MTDRAVVDQQFEGGWIWADDEDWLSSKKSKSASLCWIVYEKSSFSQKECPFESIDSNSLVINHGMEMS